MAQKIMIVEDNAWIARVWATRLANEGFDVVVAMSGEEAIEKVRTDRPDLILLDIMMPGMGGFEVCQRLKISRDTSAIPIIFLSGFGNLEEMGELLELQYQHPYVHLAEYILDPDCVNLLSREVAERYQAIPIHREGKQLTVAMASPEDLPTIDYPR